MIDEYKFIEYIRERGFILLEEGDEDVSIDGVIERFKDDDEEKTIIKFWDNEKYEYPFLEIKSEGLEDLKKTLKEYQKDKEYNFEDFISLIKEKDYFIQQITADEELYF